MKRKIFAIPVFALLFFSGYSQSAPLLPDMAIRKGLVLVRVSTVKYSGILPWIREAGDVFTVTGLVLSGNKILVSAFDVRNASLLEVAKYSSYERSIATVELSDLESNLAILTVQDPAFFRDLSVLPFAPDAQPGQETAAVRIDDLFHVFRERAIVTEVQAAADIGLTYLPAAIFRTEEEFVNGGIITCEQKVCGFVPETNGKKAQAVPSSIVQAFRDMAARKPFPGFVSAGFDVENLVDPALRDFYGMPADKHGVIITRVYPGTSASGVLKKEDVILSIDGVSLDDRGYYEDSVYGRQHALMLFMRDSRQRIRRPGETLRVDVLRARANVHLDLRLAASDGRAERIPWLIRSQPKYLVENGLVFLELTGQYLRDKFGANWRSQAVELANIFDAMHYYENSGEDRVVIIAGVLPDESNRGYEFLFAAPVEGLDGKPVVNLTAMLARIEEMQKQGTATVEVTISGKRKIYLDLSHRNDINRRVSGRYQIPALNNVK